MKNSKDLILTICANILIAFSIILCFYVFNILLSYAI